VSFSLGRGTRPAPGPLSPRPWPHGPAPAAVGDLANDLDSGVDTGSETGVDITGTDHAPGNDVIVDT